MPFVSSSSLVRPLPGKLGEALTSTLASGEHVIASIHTAQGEAIAVTDARVIVLKAGLYADAGMFGKKAISYNFRDISSVEHREGLTGGHVKILVAGVSESNSSNFAAGNNSYWGKNRESENIVTYRERKLRPILRDVVSLIQRNIGAARNASSSPAAPAPNIADQLVKLQELRASGVLTDEEFVSAKQRIIVG